MLFLPHLITTSANMGLKIPLRSTQIHSARAVALGLMNFLNPRDVIRKTVLVKRRKK